MQQVKQVSCRQAPAANVLFNAVGPPFSDPAAISSHMQDLSINAGETECATGAPPKSKVFLFIVFLYVPNIFV